MKILFIYPDICALTGSFYQGIGSISSFLKKHGHETALIHLMKEPEKENIIKQIKENSPDLIAFASTTNQFQFIEPVARWVEETFPNIPTICGGIHATMDPETVIKTKGIDMVCVGEGENAMLELVEAIENKKPYKNILNIWVRENENITQNPVRPLIENLDSLPLADREIFNFGDLIKESKRADIIIGRGCPFQCSYCLNHKIMDIYQGKGKYVRIRSVDNILSEIHELVKKYNIEIINFGDDTCTLDPEWVKEMCEKYPKEFSIPFEMNMRVETVNKEMLQMLKKAGCREARFGIESGSEWLRKNVLQRNMSNEKIIQAFKDAKEAGLKTYSYNMIGLPFETLEMVEETIKLNKTIKPDYIQVSVFYPYPGTGLYKICEKNNFLSGKKDKITGYFETNSTLNLPTLTKKQIKKYWEDINAIVFENTLQRDFPKFKFIYTILSKAIGKQKAGLFLTKIKKVVKK